MAYDNTVTVSGNATRDPELRYTTSGRGVASFGLAVSRRFQRNGEWEEDTSFFDITAWADLGEHVAATVEKGMRVIVTGRLEQRRYTDRDGNERTTIQIVADDIGPSLKWAEATVQRITRDGGNQTTTRDDKPIYDTEEEPF